MSTTRNSPESQTPSIDTSTAPFPYGERASGKPLARYQTRGQLMPADPADAVGTAGDLECPACDEAVIDGAGLFACRSCSWTGSLR